MTSDEREEYGFFKLFGEAREVTRHLSASMRQPITALFSLLATHPSTMSTSLPDGERLYEGTITATDGKVWWVQTTFHMDSDEVTARFKTLKLTPPKGE